MAVDAVLAILAIDAVLACGAGVALVALRALLAVLAVDAVLAWGAGVALVALRALLAILAVDAVLAVLACGAGVALRARLAVLAILAVGTLDLAEVLSVTVVISDDEFTSVVDFCLDDVARLLLFSLRLHVHDDLHMIHGLVRVGDGDLTFLVVADSVGVRRVGPLELRAFRQLISILHRGLRIW